MLSHDAPMDFMPFAVALGIGLLVGADRERRKSEAPTRAAAGIRTFAVTALIGATARALGSELLLATLVAALSLLLTAAYLQPHDDPGITTETALLATLLLGALAVTNAPLAAALGVSLAVVLAARTPLHQFVRNELAQAELSDALTLAASALVVLPMLPDRTVDPFGAVNPHTIWRFAVIMMAIGAAGHIAQRTVGPRLGLPLAGLLSGFVSSLATIAAMGRRAAASPQEAAHASAAAVLSTVATPIQLALVIGVVHEPTLEQTALPLTCATIAALACSGFLIWRAVRAPSPPAPALGRPVDLKTALALTATISVLLVAAALLQRRFGALGVLVAALIGGFGDTHSAAATVSAMAAQHRIGEAAAAVPILAAFTSNACAKAIAAFMCGRGNFRWVLIGSLSVAVAAAWAAYGFARGGGTGFAAG